MAYHPLFSLTQELWATSAILLPLTALILHLVYHAIFHPLSKVPGPLLARVSGLPSWYYATRGDRHIWLWQLFETYGPRIRISPNTVLFRDPDAYRDIYTQRANVQKGPFYEAWQKDKNDVNTFNTRHKIAHARRRKMLNQSFTDQSLRAAEPFVIRHIDRWNDLLVEEDRDKSHWSEPVNFADVSDTLIFDIMGDLCFGTSFDTKEPGDNPLKSMPHTVAGYMEFFYPLTRSSMLESILWLKPRGFDYLMKLLTPPTVKQYTAFVEACVTRRLELYRAQKQEAFDKQRKDMFWFLCDAKNDNEEPAYTHHELLAEANMLIIAGTDTTSVTLAAIMFYITRDSFRYKKLVHEIRSKFSSAEEIFYGPELTSCVYLKACIDESMRLTPSGPSELPRQVLKGGAMINKEFYPEGTIVGAAGWPTGHDQLFYGDSEIFRPERWIPDDTAGISQESVNRLRSNFHPFAQGPGSCPGKNFALMELTLVLARTLYRVDVRRPLAGDYSLGEGSPSAGWGKRNKNLFQLKDAYISIRNGPMVQFRKRGVDDQ